MHIAKIHSFLVHPAKRADEQPKIGGTSVRNDGKLYEMLSKIFDKAPLECDIEIAFQPDSDGKQQNPCREDLVHYAAQPTMAHGRAVARRLQAVTTHRSGLGLLFLMTGAHLNSTRLVVSRFPADSGILAEEHQERLSVEFIERVFMKSANAYKSAFYESNSTERGFWDGKAVDRQVSGPRELSDYWIQEFLISELRTTGPAGTKRMAVALRAASRESDRLDIKQELVAAAALLRSQDGKVVTGRKLIDRLGLSDDATSALEHQLPRPELLEESFRFDREEFERHLVYRLVELDNGGMLLAEDEHFTEVFDVDVVDEVEQLVRISTEGHVVDERLRKSK